MTLKEKQAYEDTENLRKILHQLEGRKFKLDCGHHFTVSHHLGNDIMIHNGKHLKIVCSLCSY